MRNPHEHFTRRLGDRAYIPVNLRTVASSPLFSPDGKRVLFAGA